jgi:gliding motility-associated-like protein
MYSQPKRQVLQRQTTIGNVTTNDTLNGVPVTSSNTDVTPVTQGPLTIDANGELTLAPNTPSGTYPITYTICEVNPTTGVAVVPANCDTVTDTVTVLNPIDAVVDIFPTQTPSTTAPTTVGDVTTNDTLNGVLVTTTNTDVTPVTNGPLTIDANGILTLAPNTPSGTYPITYTICEVNPTTGVAVVPANCDTVTDTVTVLNPIDAVVDVFPTQTPSTTAPTTVGDVTTNDTLNGVPVTSSNTDVTPVTQGPLTIDANGILTLAPNTPSGTYPITYTICEVNPTTGVAVVPANCDTVTDTVTVLNPIDAVVDVYPTQTSGATPTTVGNVTVNDTLNGVIVTADNTDVTPVTNGPLTIDANGVLTLAPNTPSGTYPITYTICEINPTTGLAVAPPNCDTVTDTVTVLNPIDAVVDVFPTQTPSTTAPTTIGNVTTNDTLNGVPVTANNTDVTPVDNGPLHIDSNGVLTLDPNTPSGTYPITYTICEVNPATGVAVVPANCDTVTDTVTVLNPIDAVVDVFPTQTPSTTTPTTVGDVTTNDTLNGVPVTANNTDVTPVDNGPLHIDSNGVLTLDPNTPSGTYPITYTICEVNPATGLAVVPANCDTVTDTITVANVIDAVVDGPTHLLFSTTPVVVGNVTVNDTLNGLPVTLTNTNVTAVTQGPLSIDADGVLTLAANTLPGTYVITYQICEADPATGLNVVPANCDTTTATVTVNDTYATNDINDTLINTPVSGNVLTNDTDPNGNTQTVTPVANGTFPEGTLVLTSDGHYTFTPANNWTGTFNYTYTVCDNGLPVACTTAVLSIEVLPIPIPSNNNDVVANNDTATTEGVTPVVIHVLSNDYDPNGNVFTITSNTPASNGTVTNNGDGTFTYTPNAGFSGTDTFTYTICDNGSPVVCDTATVTITVNQSNTTNETVANDDSYVGTTTITGNVITNDTDPEGNTQLVTTTSPITTVNGGTVVMNPNGTFTYTPNAGYTGPDSFTYTVCDNGTPQACDTATVHLLITPAPSVAITKDSSLSGNVITYTYTVTNTGNIDLTGVNVLETAANFSGTGTLPNPVYLSSMPQAGSSATTLAVGAVSTYTATYTLTQADIDAGQVSNLASACGTASGITVCDNSTDPTPCVAPDCTPVPTCLDCTLTGIIQTPSINVTKDAILNTNVAAPNGEANVNDTITYMFVVTNTGNVTVTGVTISDTLLGATPIVVTPSTLLPGQTGTATATYLLTQPDITAGVVYNLATANGTGPKGQPVTDISVDPTNPVIDGPYYNPSIPTQTVTPLASNPEIAIVKEAVFNEDALNAQVGDTITYTFTVTNTGNVPLSNVSISDPLITDQMAPNNVFTFDNSTDTNGNGMLDLTETWIYTATYELTQQDIINGQVTNQAIASGTGPITPTNPTGLVVTDASDESTASQTDNDPTETIFNGCQINVYNAITPNGDGDNDIIRIDGISCYPKNKVEIYNRWGVLVYEVEGYDNTTNVFTGYSNGRVTIKQGEGLPTGTYYYVLEYTNANGESNSKAGYLYLTRD